MEVKGLTCGVIVTNGTKFLIGRLTPLQRIWDIPKGGKHSNEEPIEAALRELKEETGITAKTLDLIDIGQYRYRPEKDIYLFLYYITPLPSIDSLKCTSFVQMNGYAEMQPEMNEYRYIDFEEIEQHFGNNMIRVLRSIRENYIPSIAEN